MFLSKERLVYFIKIVGNPRIGVQLVNRRNYLWQKPIYKEERERKCGKASEPSEDGLPAFAKLRREGDGGDGGGGTPTPTLTQALLVDMSRPYSHASNSKWTTVFIKGQHFISVQFVLLFLD